MVLNHYHSPKNYYYRIWQWLANRSHCNHRRRSMAAVVAVIMKIAAIDAYCSNFQMAITGLSMAAVMKSL